MGDTNSVPQDPSAAESKAQQLNSDFLRKGLDGKTTIESVFAGDEVAIEEINRIVAELEGTTRSNTASKVDAESEKRANVLRKKELASDKSVAKNAESQADDWLQRQIQEGLNAETAGHQSTQAPSVAKENVKHDSQQAGAMECSASRTKSKEKDIAKAEQAARASLWAMHESSKFGVLGSRLSCLPIPSPPSSSQTEGSVPVPPALKKAIKPRNTPEFYKLLDVGVDATFDEIKKGYRKEALKWHPDKNREQTELATERFKKITEAFDTLYDPERRAAYDAGELQHEPGRLKKLAGHGWSSLPDDDDLALTPLGLKWKKTSWRSYVLMYGRLDDDPADIIQDENDPRAPEIKIKIFWRFLAEMAHIDRENEVNNWLDLFIAKVWKDTPSKWPKGLELKSMNETSQQEWKERRMVFNRRKQKIRLHIELHERYLAIPDRERKEVERIGKRNPVWVRSFGMDHAAGIERQGADKMDRSSSHLKM